MNGRRVVVSANMAVMEYDDDTVDSVDNVGWKDWTEEEDSNSIAAVIVVVARENMLWMMLMFVSESWSVECMVPFWLYEYILKVYEVWTIDIGAIQFVGFINTSTGILFLASAIFFLVPSVHRPDSTVTNLILVDDPGSGIRDPR